MQFKYYLGYENDRNTQNAELFVTLLQHAMDPKEVVLVGHHFVCELNGDLKTLNEIPSADTLLFDHEIMKAVFGDGFMEVMLDLARSPAANRQNVLRVHLAALDRPQPALRYRILSPKAEKTPPAYDPTLAVHRAEDDGWPATQA